MANPLQNEKEHFFCYSKDSLAINQPFLGYKALPVAWDADILIPTWKISFSHLNDYPMEM